MPRRTTLPVWSIPTSAPSGPHTVDEVLAVNEALIPWSEMLSLAVEARNRQIEILGRWIEASHIASQIVRPGAFTTWIEGTIADTTMMLESVDSVIRAIDGYITHKLDPNATNAPKPKPEGEIPENKRQIPNFTDRMRTVTERRDR